MVNKINIRDVAKRSGVSIATVSHVINQTKNVSPATKKKVEDSIKELGYVINSAARSLKTGTRKMIGCIIPDISNYFWAVIIEEIEDYLSSCGYHPVSYTHLLMAQIRIKRQTHLVNRMFSIQFCRQYLALRCV